MTQLTFRGYSIKFRLPQFGDLDRRKVWGKARELTKACSDRFLLGHQEKSYVQTGEGLPGVLGNKGTLAKYPREH